MLTKDQIARKILKLRALAERPGSPAEGDAAREAIRSLMKDYGITDDDLRLRAAVDEATTGPDRAAAEAAAWGTWQNPTERLRRRGPPSGRPEPAAGVILSEHHLNPNRVHLAYDYMSSVCGVQPSFVWVFEREKLLTFDDPCPFCLATGMVDTRRARKRLGPA